jgi:lipid-A-disaccharide synthase
MIVIFPFEQEFYARHGVEVSYVGHPLAYVPQPQTSREEFAAQHGLDPRKQWIALLPGSRRKELGFNIERMLWAGEMLNEQSGLYEFVLPVASTLSKEWLASKLGNLWISSIRLTLTHNARATLMHARAAVVASGTATVEAALSGTPFVVVYRLAPLTWLLGRKLVKLDTFAMPNLIAGKKVVPELIQKDVTAQNVVRELNAIIPDGPIRRQMEADLKMVQQRLHDSPDAESPAQRAAREIVMALRPA